MESEFAQTMRPVVAGDREPRVPSVALAPQTGRPEDRLQLRHVRVHALIQAALAPTPHYPRPRHAQRRRRQPCETAVAGQEPYGEYQRAHAGQPDKGMAGEGIRGGILRGRQRDLDGKSNHAPAYASPHQPRGRIRLVNEAGTRPMRDATPGPGGGSPRQAASTWTRVVRASERCHSAGFSLSDAVDAYGASMAHGRLRNFLESFDPRLLSDVGVMDEDEARMVGESLARLAKREDTPADRRLIRRAVAARWIDGSLVRDLRKARAMRNPPAWFSSHSGKDWLHPDDGRDTAGDGSK